MQSNSNMRNSERIAHTANEPLTSELHSPTASASQSEKFAFGQQPWTPSLMMYIVSFDCNKRIPLSWLTHFALFRYPGTDKPTRSHRQRTCSHIHQRGNDHTYNSILGIRCDKSWFRRWRAAQMLFPFHVSRKLKPVSHLLIPDCCSIR